MDKRDTKSQYDALYEAYRHFRREMAVYHGVVLTTDEPMITISTGQVGAKKFNGYFHADSWTDDAGNRRDEISITRHHCLHEAEETLATLVHEMCHQAIHARGKSSRNGYHNQAWASLMIRVGLLPIGLDAKGIPTGKQTGQNAAHEIIPDGAFEQMYQSLLGKGWVLPWECDRGFDKKNKPQPAKAQRTRYMCPACGASVSGKEGLSIVCGDCRVVMDPTT